jgi:hypothetical protein
MSNAIYIYANYCLINKLEIVKHDDSKNPVIVSFSHINKSDMISFGTKLTIRDIYNHGYLDIIPVSGQCGMCLLANFNINIKNGDGERYIDFAEDLLFSRNYSMIIITLNSKQKDIYNFLLSRGYTVSVDWFINKRSGNEITILTKDIKNLKFNYEKYGIINKSVTVNYNINKPVVKLFETEPK